MFLFEELVVDIIALKDRIIYKDSDNHGSFFFFSQKLLIQSLFIMGRIFKSSATWLRRKKYEASPFQYYVLGFEI
jgi:hypothetical protein